MLRLLEIANVLGWRVKLRTFDIGGSILGASILACSTCQSSRSPEIREVSRQIAEHRVTLDGLPKRAQFDEKRLSIETEIERLRMVLRPHIGPRKGNDVPAPHVHVSQLGPTDISCLPRQTGVKAAALVICNAPSLQNTGSPESNDLGRPGKRLGPHNVGRSTEDIRFTF